MLKQRYVFREVFAPLANVFLSRLLEVTIGKLSDEVLLDIFRYYLDASPRSWPRLVQICRRWRRIVFASQQALRLRLFCTHRTPSRKSLDYWPASLPIVVEYGGSPGLDPPAPEDEDNVIAALKQSDRVGSISLTVTSSLLEKLSAIEKPFPKLEHLIILSRDSPRLTLSSAFGWGTRLRILHLTRIIFFALPQLLYSSRELIDLQLHEVLNHWLFSPEALTDALSGMPQLQSLSLHFLPTTDHIGAILLSRKRVVLPALTHLNFRGIAEYLEDLVDGIDAPHLGDIGITFFDKYIPELPKLIEFIDRIKIHNSHRRADILSSERVISISLLQPGAPTCHRLQLSSEPSTLQLSSITRICTRFSALLSNVEDLHFSTMLPSTWEDRLRSGGWLEPVNSFTGVKSFHVAGNLLIDIVRALQQPDTPLKTAFPALHKLYISQPWPHHVPLREAIVSFMVSRRLSGHSIRVEYEGLQHDSESRGAGTMNAQCHCHYSLISLE